MKFADMEPICADAADKPPQLAVAIDRDDYFAAELEGANAIQDATQSCSIRQHFDRHYDGLNPAAPQQVQRHLKFYWGVSARPSYYAGVE